MQAFYGAKSAHLEGGEEEVVLQDRLALGQLLLGALEVEVDVQARQELRHRVAELVLLLLQHLLPRA